MRGVEVEAIPATSKDRVSGQKEGIGSCVNWKKSGQRGKRGEGRKEERTSNGTTSRLPRPDNTRKANDLIARLGQSSDDPELSKQGEKRSVFSEGSGRQSGMRQRTYTYEVVIDGGERQLDNKVQHPPTSESDVVPVESGLDGAGGVVVLYDRRPDPGAKVES
jgi:hypothetical protein